MPNLDLDAYFMRIGYDGSREPTLDTLRSIQELHPAAIPFEAIDVLLDRGVDLSPAAVERKLVSGRRGGYCFEHNGLLMRVLTAMGFRVDGYLARVRWMIPADAPVRPATHMALRVIAEGQPWLVDVGFGGVVPTSPLRIESSAPQGTSHETYRVVTTDKTLLLQVRLEEEWKPVYALLSEPGVAADYELANWYTSTHPSSRFRNSLMVTKTSPEARFMLLDNRLTIRDRNGTLDRVMLDADGIRDALAEQFNLPVAAEWDPLIEKAAASVPPGLAKAESGRAQEADGA